jgi:hypothetical protein
MNFDGDVENLFSANSKLNQLIIDDTCRYHIYRDLLWIRDQVSLNDAVFEEQFENVDININNWQKAQ